MHGWDREFRVNEDWFKMLIQRIEWDQEEA